MKRKIVTAVFLILVSVCILGQDIITYRNGNEVKAKVTEVTPTEVKFKKYDNIDGPGYVELKANIFMIKYENGNKDVFTEQQVIKTEAEIKNTGDLESGTLEVENKDDEDIVDSERRRYGGPRLGCTYIGEGAFADALIAEGKRNIYSQFGWQFEARMFTLQNGLSGMIEFVPLVGGIDMGKFIPSVSLLLGVRAKNGIEVGVGPNYAVYGGKDIYGTYKYSSNLGIVIAAGMSIKSDKIYFPINLAVVPSVTKKTSVYDPITQTNVPYKYETGIKVSLLVGFNYRKR